MILTLTPEQRKIIHDTLQEMVGGDHAADIELVLCNRLSTMRHHMTFEQELKFLLNKYSMEIESNTPDFILSSYLMSCLHTWNAATPDRDRWMKRDTF